MMADGIIIKALSGFYYVQDISNQQVYQCRGRGILKKNNQSPMVGDQVVYSPTSNKEGVIEDLKPRKNEFFRPKVANVDQVILVFTFVEPPWNQHLLDRFIVMAESVSVESVIVINKMDLLTNEQFDEMEVYKKLYEQLGYRVVLTSIAEDVGRQEMLEVLKNKISMFSGQSGVGKSSLLNVLEPGLELKTGVVSNKLKRGKHTTTHVELFSLANGGFIVDTPGFSQIDLSMIEDISALPRFFKEIGEAGEHCKYRRCTHTVEDGCNVIEEVNQGRIQEQRYRHYIELVDELKEFAKNKY